MKRIIFILTPIVALACFCMLPGCKKINEDPSHIAQVSFPVVTLVGPLDTTINHGVAWHDPGATWIDTVTGEKGTLTAQTINTTTDSAYVLLYTATNKNGFQTAVTRGLGVTNYNGPINIAGGYSVNGGPVTITQVARALYSNPNVDGFGGGDASVMVIKSDSTIAVGAFGTYITGTNGAPLPENFTQAQILYQPPFVYTGNPPRLVAQPAVIFGYTINILNVPPASATFYQDLQ